MSERAVQTDYSAQPETIQIPTPQEAIEQEAAGETGIIGDDVETVPPLDDQHELTVAVDMKRISERI